MRDPSSLDILNFDTAVKKYKLKEVTSLLIFNNNSNKIAEESLFDEEIFGVIGSSERMKVFAYIDLKVFIIHPFIFSTLSRLYKGIGSLLLGNTHLVLKNGKLTDAKPSDVGNKDLTLITGFDVVIKYYKPFLKYLKARKGDEPTKGAKKLLATLNLIKDNEVGISKLLVMPAGYRDIDTRSYEQNNMIKYEEVNDFYLTILSMSKAANNNDEFRFKLQGEIQLLHDFLVKTKMSGKRGLIKSKLSKKPVSFGARGVIASPDYVSLKKWNSTSDVINVPTGYIGISVTMLLGMFHPYFTGIIRKDLESNPTFVTSLKYIIKEQIGEDIKTIPQLTEIMIKIVSKDQKIFGQKMLKLVDEEDSVWLTVLDYLKDIAYKIVGTIKTGPKKFCIATRYPITGVHSTQYLAIVPMNGSKFKKYKGYEINTNPTSYSNAIITSLTSLDTWGGDESLSPYQVIGK